MFWSRVSRWFFHSTSHEWIICFRMNLSNVEAFVSKDRIRMGLIESQSDHVCQEWIKGRNTMLLKIKWRWVWVKYVRSDHVSREAISKQLSHQAITLHVCFCKTNKRWQNENCCYKDKLLNLRTTTSGFRLTSAPCTTIIWFDPWEQTNLFKR